MLWDLNRSDDEEDCWSSDDECIEGAAVPCAEGAAVTPSAHVEQQEQLMQSGSTQTSAAECSMALDTPGERTPDGASMPQATDADSSSSGYDSDVPLAQLFCIPRPEAEVAETSIVPQPLKRVAASASWRVPKRARPNARTVELGSTVQQMPASKITDPELCGVYGCVLHRLHSGLCTIAMPQDRSRAATRRAALPLATTAPQRSDVGRRVLVHWEDERRWYAGTLTAIEAGHDDGQEAGDYHVRYDDGDEHWEPLGTRASFKWTG